MNRCGRPTACDHASCLQMPHDHSGTYAQHGGFLPRQSRAQASLQGLNQQKVVCKGDVSLIGGHTFLRLLLLEHPSQIQLMPGRASY